MIGYGLLITRSLLPLRATGFGDRADFLVQRLWRGTSAGLAKFGGSDLVCRNSASPISRARYRFCAVWNSANAALDAALDFTNRGNAEVAQQWLVISIRNHYTPADARLETFLTTIGRRKFLMPLYGELIKTPEGSRKAMAIFMKAKEFYHPIARESVSKLLLPAGPVKPN